MVAVGCWGVLFCAAAAAQGTRDLSQADHLPAGVVIPKVVCTGNPQESYALYLPSSYSPNRTWPIIYAFDPGARGQVAVETIRSAAEKHGYIVVGSNNSRNGSNDASTEAVRAMWDDTQRRFATDEHRRYFAGMSGGARVATAFAISCNGCVAGVIANAAGFPRGRQPTREMKFAYYATVGNADFNFAEFVELRRQLDETGAQYRIRVFEGEHGWAPAEVWLEALDWMDLQAMRSGSLPRDAAKIQASYDAAMQRANALVSHKEVLEALREYTSIARDFSSLADVSAAEKMVRKLSSDKQVKKAEKQESSAAADQNRFMAEPSGQMQALVAGELSASEFMSLRDSLASLLRRAGTSHREGDPRELVLRRALQGLVIEAYEFGHISMDRKQYELALRFFDLAVAGSSKPGWGHYNRARAYAAMGDKKHALAELKVASETGFEDPSALNAAEFEGFQNEAEFQEFARQWAGKVKP